MKKYTATFADGSTITRSTTRIYGVAWRSTWTHDDGNRHSYTGFAISAAKVNAYKPVRHLINNRMSSSDRTEKRRLNAEYCDAIGYRVEIVPAVLAA